MPSLITGGAGFIGAHLAHTLLKRGGSVTLVDDLSTGSLESVRTLSRRFPGRVRFVQDDCGRPGLLETLLAPGDTVYHLAATVGVNKVCENPEHTLSNSWRTTERVLAACAVRGNRLIFASTSEVYGCSGHHAIMETACPQVYPDLGGRSAYTLGKLLGEHLCCTAHQLHGLPVTVVRFFNTIGPYQSAEFGMVVPTFIRQAQAGAPITVFGDGSQTRSFMDVRDAADALVLLAESPEAIGEILNVGNPQEVTILDLATYIQRAVQSASPIELHPMPPQRAGARDIPYRMPDIGKISGMLGWRPRFSLAQTILHILKTEFGLRVSVSPHREGTRKRV